MTRHFYDASGTNISLSVTLFFIAKSLLRVNAYDNSFFRNTLTLAVIPVYVDEESKVLMEHYPPFQDTMH